MNTVKLYPIFNNVVDIFVGDGWTHWSRWYIGEGKVNHMAGMKLNPKMVSQWLK